MVPQAWSLLVVVYFYVCAPLFALLLVSAKPMFFAILLLSAGFQVWVLSEGYAFDRAVYQNYAAAAAILMCGMLLYYWREPLGRFMPGPALTGLALESVVAWSRSMCTLSRCSYRFTPCSRSARVATVALGRVRKWPRALARLEALGGDLAYGVFLNHFLAATLLAIFAERIYVTTGNVQPFGRPNTTEFGLWVSGMALSLSLLTFLIFERPIERIRDRVRRVPVKAPA
jgi:peptidoglycan/LPS O-acetylase OafA/YrhL